MNSEQMIKLVEESIQRGLEKKSDIEPWVHNLKSWSTIEIKSLLNNIGKNVNSYLEVGVFHGGTFFSAVAGNNHLNAYAVDIFVEDVNSNPGATFRSSLEGLKRDNVKFINKDCFTVEKEEIPVAIDAYLYDGPHHFDEQKKALTYYLPFMGDVFILMVDDFNDGDVSGGTREGLEALRNFINVDKEWVFKTPRNMGAIWWNGFYIAVISKKAKE